MKNVNSQFLFYAIISISYLCILAVLGQSYSAVHLILNTGIMFLIVMCALIKPLEALRYGGLYLGILIVVIFYQSERTSLFGFNSVDSAFYYQTWLTLLSESTSEKFSKITTDYAPPDWGFLLFTNLLIPNNYALSLIAYNSVFHILTAETLRYSLKCLSVQRSTARLLVALYTLNPAAIVYITNGLKEITLTFLVMLVALSIVKIYKDGSKVWMLIGTMIALSTFLFRLYYPPLLLFSIAAISWWTFSLRIKLLYSVLIIISGAYIFVILQKEIMRVLSLDLSLVRRERIEKDGLSQFLALGFSSIFGPFINVNFENNEKFLFSVGELIKNFISTIALASVIFQNFAHRRLLYALSYFIGFNAIIMVLVALSLDYRFHYPALPFYFLLASNFPAKSSAFIFVWLAFLVIAAFMYLYNLR